jgi:hypothetical protein
MTLSKTVCLIVLASQIGCASRVIYVPHGQPVRLAESVRARVYVPDKDGQQVKSQNKITIPEGWYALPKDK